MEDAMSERATNISWFWVKVTGTVLVTFSMAMCGGAEPPVDDAIVESSLVEPDVSTLTPEATDEDIMQTHALGHGESKYFDGVNAALPRY